MTRCVVQEGDLVEIDRVYFSVIEPGDDDEYGIIRVLRILHGAQQPLGDDTNDTSDA